MRGSWKRVQNAKVFHTKGGKRPSGKSTRPKRAASPLCTVYGLHCGDDVIRYVGQTRNDLQTRLGWHLLNAKTGNLDVNLWIRWRIEAGEVIHIVPLEEEAKWDVAERVWINRLGAKGPLLNMTRGGSRASFVKNPNGPTLRGALRSD